jgi:hypothetical protein
LHLVAEVWAAALLMQLEEMAVAPTVIQELLLLELAAAAPDSFPVEQEVHHGLEAEIMVQPEL